MMRQNSEPIFRKKTLEKAGSPELTDSMVRVIRPGAWAALLAVLAALAGAIVWMIFGMMSSETDAVFLADEAGKAVFYVREDQAEHLSRGSDVVIEGTEGKITRVAPQAVLAGEKLDNYEMHINGIDPETWVVKVRTNVTVTPGVHKAQLVIDRVSPFELVFGE